MAGRVAVTIQHHPKRAGLLDDLLAAVGDAVVVTDPEPQGAMNPWRTYRACLETAADLPDIGNVAVLQDDVTPCRRFRDALEAAVAARPNRVLALFHGGAPRENLSALARAHAAGETWVELNSHRWVPAVAVVWPIRLVCPVVCWVEEQDFPRGLRADDEILGRALRDLDEPVLACVPSIVQHEDAVPSLMGMRARAGGDPARVAAFWVGDADPLDLDWTAGAA